MTFTEARTIALSAIWARLLVAPPKPVAPPITQPVEPLSRSERALKARARHRRRRWGTERKLWIKSPA